MTALIIIGIGIGFGFIRLFMDGRKLRGGVQ